VKNRPRSNGDESKFCLTVIYHGKGIYMESICWYRMWCSLVPRSLIRVWLKDMVFWYLFVPHIYHHPRYLS